MTTVEIEYCVPCGLLEYAIETQETLLKEFGRDLDEVRLRPGHNGVFKVYAGDDLIWNKDEHDGEIDLEVITEAVHDRTHVHT